MSANVTITYEPTESSDSYARFQVVEGYPNQPEITAQLLSDVEMAELGALEAAATEIANRAETEAAQIRK